MSDASDRVEAGRHLFRRIFRNAVLANAVGALVAYVYLAYVAPPQPPPSEGNPWHETLHSLGVVPLYFVVAVVLTRVAGRRYHERIQTWLAEDRPPTGEERALVLGIPSRSAALTCVAWVVAALVFGGQTATHHPVVYVVGVFLAIVLAGLTTTGITFLLVERAMRPLFALVLAGENPTGAARTLRTGSRLLVAWALGSGVILVAIAVAFIGRTDEPGSELIGPVLFLVVAGLFAGALLTVASGRSIEEPIDRVRAAVGRIEAGSLGEEVVVDDGGEIGFLQAGFNRMVAGLRERERIRAAFGTYVDRDVADHILRHGTAIAGEEVEVTVLFIDVADFTAFAERAAPTEVVATVNRLFERAVPIVHEHGGHVDKFVGDGLLAVFGAPRRQPDHADQALAAALEIERAVADEFGDELTIGIGLNSGRVVAGNVGGAGRFEFSVIGDAVNVAARVQDATRRTGDTVLVSEHTRALLSSGAAGRLEQRDAVPLKGKSEKVGLYAPPSAARVRQ